MTDHYTAAAHLARFLQADDRAALDWLRRGLAAWRDADGAVPLERCLHLPGSPAACARLERDRWIAIASTEVDGETPWARASALAVFMTRHRHTLYGYVRRNERPRGALELALVNALRSGAPLPRSAKQVQRILDAETQKRVPNIPLDSTACG